VVSRAGAIVLLLLGAGLIPVGAASSAASAGSPQVQAPVTVDLRLAPEPAPAPATDPTQSPFPSPTSPGVAGSPAPVDGTPPAEDPDTDEDGTAEPADPLEVSITGLTPSSLRPSGRVEVEGRVTNRSESEWTELTVYAATSATPITTEAGLAEADDSPLGVEPSDYQRIVEPGLFRRVTDLGPGESTTYRLSIPRRLLGIPTTPGVYRLGVQVLGTEDGSRAEGADGRARVLVASVPPSAAPTELALAVQVRRRTVRTPTGEVDHVGGWSRTLAESGRLREVVRLVGSAGGFPVALVLDPALVEAAGSLAEGNNGLELDDTETDGVEEVTGTITAEKPPTSPPTTGTATPDVDVEPDDAAATAISAISWLQELRAAAPVADVLAVPYGDLDLGAAARQGRQDLLGRSLVSGLSTLSAYGIEATGVAAPYHGLLGAEAAAALPRGLPALVTPRGLSSDGEQSESEIPAAHVGATQAPVWAYRPLPMRPGSAAGRSALEVRQRVLARTAVQSLTRPGEPLVVALPPQWHPGAEWSGSDFFGGLRAPWVRPVRLAALTPVRETDLTLRYPRRQLGLEVPSPVFRSFRQLVRTGGVLGDLMADNDTLAARIERQAMLGISFHSRGHVAGVTGRLRATDAVLSSRLRDVEVLAPRFVRMSSESGSFLVPVVNRLDVPVRVRLRPEVTGPDLSLEVPDPVVIEPGTRQGIRLVARTRTIGIRSVRVDLVTVAGDRLYAGPTFSVRSSQVARWVWFAMALGSAVLLVAIMVRIVRRVRVRRATPGPMMLRDEA
jgi:hypothetical protein